MARISKEDHYLEKIEPYRARIQSLLKQEEVMLQIIEKDNRGAAVKYLALVDEMIFLTSNYIVLAGVSESVLRLRNQEVLNAGRKSLYKAVIYLEKVVGSLIDAPFSEYAEHLAEIATVDAGRRYALIRKMGLAIRLLQSAYGDNTKWKWAFVELEGRYAAVAKNIIDLKAAAVNADPRSPEYEPMVRHLKLVKRILLYTASRYRDKYELSTNNIDDFRMGIQFLGALRRIHSLFWERQDAEAIKKKIDIWQTKMEDDRKKQREAAPKRIQDDQQ